MTNNTERSITPPPRKRVLPPDARGLFANNRQAPEETATATPTYDEQPAAPITRPVAQTPVRRVAQPVKEPTTHKITFTLTAELQSRLKATYLATRDLEGENTYSEMISTMLETGCNERERIYNAGEEFQVSITAIDRHSRGGRPIKG